MPTAWATGASERVGPTDAPRAETSVYNAASQIVLRGAVNEMVAFDYVLHAKDLTFTGIDVEASDLVSQNGSITRDAIHIYRRWPVTLDRFPNWYLRSTGLRKPREIPDALIPIDAPTNGRPFTIPRGQNFVLWVEIRIPPEAKAGRYSGELRVRSPGGGLIRTTLHLDVLDFFLEPEKFLPILSRVQLAPLIRAHTRLDPENTRLVVTDPDARRLITETFRLLHDHGLAPFTDEVYPRYSQDVDGRLIFDWTDYDALCGPLMDGSAFEDHRPAAAWPVPVDLRQPDPSQFSGIDSTPYAAILKQYLAGVAGHFREKDWLGKAFVYFDTPRGDEPNARDFERVSRLATLTHLVEPALPFASRLIPQSMTPFGWFGHPFVDLTAQVDIWRTPARYQHPPTLRLLQTLGKRTWLPSDRPPYCGSLAVEAPPVQARSIPWQAFLQGHEAVMLDESTNWPADVFDQPIRSRDQPSDTWLIYPGRMFGLDTPVPSVRLMQLQMGVQDHQRLVLLAQNGREETARLVAGSLIKAAGTDAYGDNYQDGLLGRRIDSPETWELARHILDDELMSVLATSIHSASAGGAPRDDWIRFLSRTRTIEAWTESSRLHFDERSTEKENWLLTYEFGVRSELRTPVEGELKFESLPYGARNISDVIRIGPLPEWGVARRRLAVRSEILPVTNLDGHLIQPVVFDAGASGRVNVSTTVSIVQAPEAPMPITIDGRLNDWPPSAFNAAGDFRLVTNRDGLGQERPRAQSQTIAYFLRGGDVLYIGLHAGMPESAVSKASTLSPLRNFVEYEDLIPVGEDLIEIILDPSNKATQTSELYHIVLKSTGNPRFERGVGTHPPIGDVQPWSGPLPECCVTRTEFGWSAEIAVPLNAFGSEAATNPVWGLNLARLEPVRGEYSDWARAPRYCYDPKSLGSLVWPE